MSRRLWIAVEAHLVKRFIVFQAAEYLGVKPVQALGHLVIFWGEVAEDARGGDISKALDAQIEDWACWDGEAGLFASFVRQFCVTDGKIKGWDAMQGPLEDRRQHDRERLKAWRAKQKEKQDGNVTGNVTKRGTEHNRTVQNKRTTTTPQPAVAADGLKAWLEPIAAAWEGVNGAGSFPWARGTKALKPLFGKVESATLAERLGRYLAADGKFASPERFVITHGQHAEAPADKHAAAVKAKRDRMFQEQGANLPNGDMTEIMDLVTNPNRVAEARRLGVIL